MDIAEQFGTNVALADYTTMKVGGAAEYFMAVRTRQQVKTVADWASKEGLPVLVLGEGSNLIVSDAAIHRMVIKIEVPGYEVLGETGESVTLLVGAGEHWDSVVARTVAQGLAGIEAMSMIPGTTGATPVQNAGAYGQEIADTLVELEAYDMREREFVTIPAADCGFAYRTSAFKKALAGRYIIVSVTLKLSKRPPARPTYESLKRWLDEHAITEPTLAQIREGVMAVRRRILPDPSVVPNTGSFFQSPIVTAAKLQEIESKYDKVPSYKYGESYKIAAGWILEQCGFKGSEHFGFKVWPNHALVITNPYGSSYADLMKLVELIVRTVQDKFGITLAPEPEFIRQ